jgi:hypothetical protein
MKKEFRMMVKDHDFSGTLGAVFKLSLGSLGDLLLWIGLPMLLLGAADIAVTEIVGSRLALELEYRMLLAYAGFIPMILLLYLTPVFLTGYLSDRYLDINKKGRMGKSILLSFKRFFSLVGTGFLAGGALMLGFILLYVPGVILSLGWYNTLQAVIVERLSPIKALKRSWDLTKGERFKILGLYLVCYGIGYTASMVLAIPLYVVMIVVVMASAFGGEAGVPSDETMIRMMIYIYPAAMVISLPLMLLFASLSTVIYYNLRIRKEGFIPDTLKAHFEKPMEGSVL